MDNLLESPSIWSGHFREAVETNARHKSELLDEGLDESFPASDPTAISITRVVSVPPLLKPEEESGAE